MHVQHFYPPLFHSPRVFVAKFNILWLSCCGAGVGNSSMCATNKIFMDTNKHWYVCKHLWVVNCMKTSCVKAHQRAKNLRTSSSSRSKDVKKAWIHHFLYCRLYRNIRCWQTVTLPKAWHLVWSLMFLHVDLFTNIWIYLIIYLIIFK